MDQPSRQTTRHTTKQTPRQTSGHNDGQSSTSDKGINLIVGVFLLVSGILSVMFHFILFPLIGLFVGIPLLIAGGVFVARHRRGGGTAADGGRP